MEKVLNGEPRENPGVKGVLKTLRKSGKIPAVVYGENAPSASILVDARQFLKIVSAEANAIIKLKYLGKEENVIVKELQRHVVSGEILHVDFMRISFSEEIEVSIPVHLTGEPHGVKNQGGILQHGVRKLTVKCMPSEIPNEIKVDISRMQLNDVLKVGDIKLKNASITEGSDIIVASILPPMAEKPEEPGAAVETAEPEVVEKGKKEEDKKEEK